MIIEEKWVRILVKRNAPWEEMLEEIKAHLLFEFPDSVLAVKEIEKQDLTKK
jgi:hypothetical protein